MEKIGDENDRAAMHKDFLLWATEHEGVVFLMNFTLKQDNRSTSKSSSQVG